ncbi:hypothetical protein EYZ11_002992 [Aspergillus tanneri]|uniref:SnoaL-like domain-containing protein n=1 Tax=Aspergillus tanneri TaxID=1220188 RepID=A0A4S3JPG5_9EURO|nr:hypothetical protein EYZ11_002992 [Aspergillus tanneri]
MWWTPATQPQPFTNLPPPSSDEIDAIVAVAKGFLAALNTKSLVEFDKYCVRAGGMALCPPPPTLPRFCTIGAFAEQIARVTDEIDERIWDLEVKAYGFGNLAAVWAPFRAKINGIVDHTANGGRETITCLRGSAKTWEEEEGVKLI